MGKGGLTSQEAQVKLAQVGLNEIAVKTKRTAGSIFFAQFANILIVLLTLAALVSFFLGDIIDSIFIAAIIILNGVLGFIQEYRAEKAVAALQKLTVVKTTVIRDGIEQEIDSKFLVPGDIIKVEEGDKIPADSKILESVNFEVNEASLTGESLPVFKKEGEKEHEQIFMGTIVVRGRALAFVEKTGNQTRFGSIAKGLSEITDEKTPLAKQLEEIGKKLGFLAIGASALVLFLGVLRSQEFFPLFLISVSLAVAAVPEGLPAVITITLAVGVHRMARERAIARKMAAIETLGSTTIIAADKTGTITQNKMRVRQIFTNGKTIELDHLHVKQADVLEVLQIGCIANTASLVFKHDGNSVDVIGDSTEGALLLAAHDVGIDPAKLKAQGELLDEFSFDTTRKTMSVVWKDLPAGRQGDGKVFVYVKGSPERILAQSTLTPQKKKAAEAAFQKAAKKGFRIIAVAKKELPARNATHSVRGGKGSKKLEVRNRDEVESNLTFVGFAAIADPPRPEVKEAARLAAEAGIKTVMITGDNELTANAIAQEVGLIEEGEDVLTGQQLDGLSDDELHKVLPNVRIFARTTPAHKLRIVQAYQAAGHVVAVTGDGVNDALALKQAHVGIAMGITGTDVAKEAADIIVTDDNYATIVGAIEEGRVIYDNIVKSVVYLISGNLGEILTILGAVAVGFFVSSEVFIPLTATQILWINLITDGLPALALAIDSKDPHVMKRGPRGFGQTILSGKNLRFILMSGVFISSITFLLFNLLFFTFWILANTGNVPGVPVFDPFPFILLTMIVSLEAIVLTVIVLVSQNRQAEITTLREELDMQVNLMAEREITKVLDLQKIIIKKLGVKIKDPELEEMTKETDISYIEQQLAEQIKISKRAKRA